MTILNNEEMDKMIRRHREDATKWLLPGLIGACVAGVLIGMAIRKFF